MDLQWFLRIIRPWSAKRGFTDTDGTRRTDGQAGGGDSECGQSPIKRQ